MENSKQDPGLGPEEYVETDYYYDKSKEEMEEEGNIEEVPSEPHSSEMIQDHPTTPEDSTNRLRLLEENVTTLCGAVRAQQRNKKITREMIELANLMA
ncbi:unnamed protein product [Lactuca saligna]|uniref:Uncharacterized protein n=1 Tax=Lactuca saligna TaxID=75948 RepID=A0AA35V3S0_LACSI|nr:unnamed protein product [Lactuca saligna]